MNETLLVFLVIFLPLFILKLIRLIFRFSKSIKKESGDQVFLAEGLDDLCCFALEITTESADCCLAIKREGKDEKIQDDFTIKRDDTVPFKKKRGLKSRISKRRANKKRNKVLQLISKEEKISLDFICMKASISKNKLIEIISELPDYFIDDAYIINRKLLAKDYQSHLYDKIREIHKQKSIEDK
ncbi:MAG: hypothetical protein EAX90_06895 [Candidatus Heimdallarchaeota archaeon]|nr:hypothetical protein [Candidatus Heimdallarchaeota archaeon]